MNNKSKTEKKFRKSPRKNGDKVVGIRLNPELQKMLLSIKDVDLETDSDVIRKLIKAEYERKINSNVTR